MTVPVYVFVSRNRYKLAEAAAILDPLGIAVVPVERTIEELQTADTEALVRDKALRATMTTREKALDFVSKVLGSVRIAGVRTFSSSSTVAVCIVAGNVSLDERL
jgi:hypothetical protein